MTAPPAQCLAVRAAAVLCATAILCWCTGGFVAKATGDAIALNGRYVVVSDGQWAKTNDRYHDELTVTSTWSIASTCADYQDCTGRVVSDAGWSADLVYLSGHWRVHHTIDSWQHCADGSTAPGEQSYEFWKVRKDSDQPQMIGQDRTTGPSGACGVNKWLTISMPLTVTPAG